MFNEFKNLAINFEINRNIYVKNIFKNQSILFCK